MSQFELISQFTEDAYATEDCLCKHPTCRLKIAKGAPCFYVATIEPEKPGRHVCGPCYACYQTKVATSVRSVITVGTLRSVSCHTTTDQPMINPPHVVAFSQAHIGQSMRPPPATHSAGPAITVLSSWDQPQDITHAHCSSGPSGYSENHANYGAQRKCWAKLAYALPPMDTITLEILAVHEGGARKKGHGVPIGNICEGKKDVDARIDAPGLMEIAFDTIIPKILMFGAGFPWRIKEFVVRDAMWVDLSTHAAALLYFFSQCMITSKKGSKGLTFKTKQFALMVVVPEAQWNEYEEWVEKPEEVC
ncbi:hypothetical protein CY34DRAFT_101312 [Suillus luteus UH-Slu-Lm8-n1]|uniref:Unplaced genomic scaffold CY34scaffold_1071, whole genome shotgun sequence n=1 Tax=Suillus luteus UH-Slu-Lm8-n1 TaxID=930992 RepID=A0A0C9ZTC3_9AGAM|nr:hypothetical protein CY34DRAFT_101312 [Suillus luteus UH-Slu-Lm8-n1]